MNAVLVLDGNPRFHTSVYCPQIYYPGKTDNVDKVRVQTQQMARNDNKSRCRNKDCVSTMYYDWTNGWKLANERD